MNKNEDYQLELFTNLIKQSQERKEAACVFFNHLTIEEVGEPYDAKIKMIDSSWKMVQLTQMSNFVAINKGKIIDPTKFKISMDLPKSNDDTNQEKYAEKLRDKGIERTIVESKKGELLVIDEFGTRIGEFEINYEAERQLEGLLNGLIRSLKKKWKKYNISTKAQNSILVIIDQSRMSYCFMKIVNPSFLKANNLSYEDVEGYTITDFLVGIFNEALRIVELELGQSHFFDDIQVYFHKAQTSNSQECYFLVSTKNENKYPFNHPLSLQFHPVSIGRSYKMSKIITLNDLE